MSISLLSNKYILIDSSVLIANICEPDNNHQQSITILDNIENNRLMACVTPHIIAETHAGILRASGNITLAADWLSQSAYQDFLVLRPNEEIESRAVAAIAKYQDKDYSFADMLSFEIMKLYDIILYASFDHHFAQIGKFLDIRNILK